MQPSNSQFSSLKRLTRCQANLFSHFILVDSIQVDRFGKSLHFKDNQFLWFTLKELSWQFLHNRRVYPQWSVLMHFYAHKWIPDTKGAQNMQSQGQGIKFTLFEKSACRPSILDRVQFSLSKLSFLYLKYPKYAISGSRVEVYIFGKIDVETLTGPF